MKSYFMRLSILYFFRRNFFFFGCEIQIFIAYLVLSLCFSFHFLLQLKPMAVVMVG